MSTNSAVTPKDDWPSIVSPTLKDKIAENFRKETSSDSDHLRSFICCSCSVSAFVDEQVIVDQTTVNLSCLQHPHTRLFGMPADLHNMSNVHLEPTHLSDGILLDCRGISDNDSLLFCKDCYSHIKRSKTPPHSLANHLLLGDVPPELQSLSPVEETLIARCRAKAFIVQLKAEDHIALPNTQRGMHGHIIIYPQKPDNLLNVLPSSATDVSTPICVVFIGSQWPTREWLRNKAKPLIVRRERIQAALLWLKNNNELYRDILIDEMALTGLPEDDILPNLHIEVVDNVHMADVLTSRYDKSNVKIPSIATQQMTLFLTV